jgi:hypothetical protein
VTWHGLLNLAGDRAQVTGLAFSLDRSILASAAHDASA